MTGMGSTDLKRHLAGMDLTAMQAIRAKCADCTGNYADGRISCELPECPLVSRRAKTKAGVTRPQAEGNNAGEAVERILGC